MAVVEERTRVERASAMSARLTPLICPHIHIHADSELPPTRLCVCVPVCLPSSRTPSVPSPSLAAALTYRVRCLLLPLAQSPALCLCACLCLSVPLDSLQESCDVARSRSSCYMTVLVDGRERRERDTEQDARHRKGEQGVQVERYFCWRSSIPAAAVAVAVTAAVAANANACSPCRTSPPHSLITSLLAPEHTQRPTAAVVVRWGRRREHP